MSGGDRTGLVGLDWRRCTIYGTNSLTASLTLTSGGSLTSIGVTVNAGGALNDDGARRRARLRHALVDHRRGHRRAGQCPDQRRCGGDQQRRRAEPCAPAMSPRRQSNSTSLLSLSGGSVGLVNSGGTLERQRRQCRHGQQQRRVDHEQRQRSVRRRSPAAWPASAAAMSAPSTRSARQHDRRRRDGDQRQRFRHRGCECQLGQRQERSAPAAASRRPLTAANFGGRDRERCCHGGSCEQCERHAAA